MAGIWMTVSGYPEFEVSTLGIVRDKVTKAVRRPYMAESGHLNVSLESKKRLVHRLVLETFVGQAPDGQECRHLNGVPYDNRLENLAWGTHLENMMDSVEQGTRARGQRNARSKLTEEQVLEVRALHAEGLLTQYEIADKMGVKQATVSSIVLRKTWRHL